MTKKTIVLLLCLLCSGFAMAQPYVFFLHNKFLEDHNLNDVHPQYGKYEYKEILKAFEKEGLTVISETRPANTDVNIYAKKIVTQIDSIIGRGVKPSQITVMGASKGGFIAMQVSSLLKNKNVNFVFIACCAPGDEDNAPGFSFYGNILSIYEKSDMMQSCSKMKDRSVNNVTRFKELELNTGLQHGFQFKALEAWIKPAVKWAKQDYR